MRQIFHLTPQQTLHAPDSQDVIYPALPNVSKQRSPTMQRLIANRPTSSQHSPNGDRTPSGSWSDDSSYMNGGRQYTSTALATSSDMKVNDWLSATHDDNLVSTREGTDSGSLGLEELQLSPLSPNVCTKRGPSRYHESYNPRVTIDTSPTKVRSLPRLQQRLCHENLSPNTNSTALSQDHEMSRESIQANNVDNFH